MNNKRQRRLNVSGYLFISPALIGVIVFTVLPIFISLFLSLTDWKYAGATANWQFIGLKNYIDLWRDKWFLDSLKNTFQFTLVVVPVTICAALLLAVLIDFYCYGKKVLRLLLFVPYIANAAAAGSVWRIVFGVDGPINTFLRFLGVENPPSWFADKTWALPALMIIGIWSMLGYTTMIYSSALQGVPKDLLEAAEIDGANGVRRFFKIIIPAISPTSFFLLITNLINSFQVFTYIKVITQGGPGSSTSALVYYTYVSGFQYYKMGYASAIAYILFIILMVITLIQWRNRDKWEQFS